MLAPLLHGKACKLLSNDVSQSPPKQHLSDYAGSIPSTLGNAAELTTLALEKNQLTGSIPAAVAALPQLQSIRLYNNSLSGSAAAKTYPSDCSVNTVIAQCMYTFGLLSCCARKGCLSPPTLCEQLVKTITPVAAPSAQGSSFILCGGGKVRQNEQALSCRVMPDKIASNSNLEEVDVGFNALTAMPPSWISGSAFAMNPPTQSSIAYIGMDSNAITVGLLVLDLLLIAICSSEWKVACRCVLPICADACPWQPPMHT